MKRLIHHKVYHFLLEATVLPIIKSFLFLFGILPKITIIYWSLSKVSIKRHFYQQTATVILGLWGKSSLFADLHNRRIFQRSRQILPTPAKRIFTIYKCMIVWLSGFEWRTAKERREILWYSCYLQVAYSDPIL